MSSIVHAVVELHVPSYFIAEGSDDPGRANAHQATIRGIRQILVSRTSHSLEGSTAYQCDCIRRTRHLSSI